MSIWCGEDKQRLNRVHPWHVVYTYSTSHKIMLFYNINGWDCHVCSIATLTLKVVQNTLVTVEIKIKYCNSLFSESITSCHYVFLELILFVLVHLTFRGVTVIWYIKSSTYTLNKHVYIVDCYCPTLSFTFNHCSVYNGVCMTLTWIN